jgi:5-formyltetrahydrofolate cyclo-ligase
LGFETSYGGFLVKAELRRLAKVTLTETLSDEIQQQMLEALARFFSSISGVWGGFLPLPLEPDLPAAWQLAQRAATPPRIKWVFPKINNELMEFYSADSGVVAHPRWKTSEPKGVGLLFSPSEIQGLLIPGLGFSLDGVRLGRGKGFYDRYLSKFRGQRVGVCFESQIFSQLPVEAHDEKVDFILTEKRFIRVSEDE